MNNIPGYEKMDGIEILYIQGEPSSNFNKVTRFVQPPLPKGEECLKKVVVLQLLMAINFML